MFTGIIEEVGAVKEADRGRLVIACREVLEGTALGDSIAVNGASLTVIAKDETSFSVSLVRYTQEHTNLTHKKPGDSANLESDIIARYVDQLLSERRG